MIFFFDRNIAERHARIIDAFESGHTIVHQDNDTRFNPTTSDVELIQMLAREKPTPVFITADEAIRRRPEERKALAESNLTVVFFRGGWHQIGFHEQAVKLLKI